MYSLTFCVRVMLPQQRNRCTDCKSEKNSAQLGGNLYHAPKLHPGPCSSVGVRPRTDTQTHTQTRVTTIHFASSTTHAKCNQSMNSPKYRADLNSQADVPKTTHVGCRCSRRGSLIVWAMYSAPNIRVLFSKNTAISFEPSEQSIALRRGSVWT